MERKLRRSRDEHMVFGVCTGLARYFDVDVTIVRIVFVLLAFANGMGILAYVILAIVMPAEGSEGQAPRDVMRENVADLGTATRDLGRQFRTGFGGETIDSEPVPEVTLRNRHATAGIILIALGLLFLLTNLGLFWWLDWGRLWPLVLIALGIAIIWQRRR